MRIDSALDLVGRRQSELLYQAQEVGAIRKTRFEYWSTREDMVVIEDEGTVGGA